MSKKLIEDAEEIYSQWREAPSGSYLESTLADTMVTDLFPSLLHVAKRKVQKMGFSNDGE